MNRRSSLSLLAALVLVPLLAGSGRARAQRPSQPIYRPVPGRPGRPARPGRLYGTSGYGAAPGVFVVAGVNSRDGLLRLRDEDGQTAEVYVSHRLFDIDTLKAGDEVAVDFFVGGDNDERLEAASIFKVERVGG
jgi:hypothetical protein